MFAGVAGKASSICLVASRERVEPSLLISPGTSTLHLMKSRGRRSTAQWYARLLLERLSRGTARDALRGYPLESRSNEAAIALHESASCLWIPARLLH